MPQPETLPIFPLPMVILPSEYHFLHVFEDRYKKLVCDCRERLAAGECPEFGILYCHNGNLSCTGTSVTITHILREFDDGCCEIVVRGQRRFRVQRVKRFDLYDAAEITRIEDAPDDDWDEALATQAYTLHRRLFEILNGSPIPDHAYCQKASLSMHIGQLAGLTPAQKLDLLSMCRENERLQFLVTHLQRLLPLAEKTDAARQQIQDAWAIVQFLRGEELP